MPKSENQKQTILFVMDYLQKHSHKDHPVNTVEIIRMLRQEGISADRKSIYSDIKALTEYGLDIVSLPGKNGGYYIASPKDFQLSELKLLIDAVLSSKYLTEKKSRELIRKLCDLCGTDKEAELMQRNLLVSGRVKSMNESIYYNIDVIQEAIAKNEQISFRYFDWDMKATRAYREKEYLASPYGLCQDNENCYLLAYSERHGVTSYRADRMDNIQLTGKKRVPCPELTGKALIDHANQLFQMFAGDACSVKLRFHKSLLNVVIDRFGKDIPLVPIDDEHFEAKVNVAISPQFFGWIMALGKGITITGPEPVVRKMREEVRRLSEQYGEK